MARGSITSTPASPLNCFVHSAYLSTNRPKGSCRSVPATRRGTDRPGSQIKWIKSSREVDPTTVGVELRLTGPCLASRRSMYLHARRGTATKRPCSLDTVRLIQPWSRDCDTTRSECHAPEALTSCICSRKLRRDPVSCQVVKTRHASFPPRPVRQTSIST